MKMLLSGNYAAAYAAKLCRVQVVPVYPITPQTSVAEKIAELGATGQMPARMMRVESEHTAMSACIGAAMVGARVFTASSSQGIAYMHEMIHWAAGSRLPIVMVAANRSLGSPWNLGCDQIDTLVERDAGWLQFYCEDNQEVLDTVIQAYRVAETVYLPAMVALDGFFLTHTTEAVEVPDGDLVDRYLPPFQPLYRLDVDNPQAFAGTTTGEEYTHFHFYGYEALQAAKDVVDRTAAEFEATFGRRHDAVEADCLDDAVDLAIVTAGSVAGTVRQVVGEMRAAGQKVGHAKIRLLRPFPKDDLIAVLGRAKKVAVIDRNGSMSTGGIFGHEIRAALYDAPGFGAGKPVFGFVAAVGGVDFTPGMVHRIVAHALSRERPEQDTLWVGVEP